MRARPGVGDLLAVALLIAVWSVATRAQLLPSIYLPSLGDVWNGAVSDWDRLGTEAWKSLRIAGIGYIIGFATGAGFGVLLGRYGLIKRWLGPSVDFTRAIPAVVTIPVALFIFADRTLVAIFAVGWACFFLTTINTSGGTQSTSVHTLENVVRSFGGREHQVILKVITPALLPYLLASLRQNVAVALLVVIVADMALGVSGLGFYILRAQGVLRSDLMYAAIVLLSLVGFGGYRLLEVLGRRAFPWWSEVGGSR